MQRRRWLPDFPNYERARPVPETSASISEADFRSTYVEQHQPCVIRCGAAHWPAIRQWSVDHLRAAVGPAFVGETSGVAFEPVLEQGISRLFQKPNTMPFSAFLDYVEKNDRPYVQLYGEPTWRFPSLKSELGGFSFLSLDRHPARIYEDRIFFSRRGYTDWHVHFGDETLTAQIRGEKEFLILPPDSRTFRAILSAAKRGVWKLPRENWGKAFASLVPYRVLLRPGDVIYIPMHWWHAVESADDEVTITVARTFQTPTQWLADLRLPNARASFWLLNLGALIQTFASLNPKPLLTALRFNVLTLIGLPKALRHNPRFAESTDVH
jgi:hypothetical protein